MYRNILKILYISRVFFLIPFAYAYGLIVYFRNYLYFSGFLSSYKSHLTVISVGNLSLGGSGKTPFLEFLLRNSHLASYSAILSRGYGRKTTGLYEVLFPLDTSKYGDEPCQLKLKFPNNIVVVCEDRIKGAKYIEQVHPDIKYILLDDGFQHIRLQRDINLLLTTYSNPFFNDFVVPAGSLREFRTGCKRADIVVVTKIPSIDLISNQYLQKINYYAPNKPIFFAKYLQSYPTLIYGPTTTLHQVTLIASIANTLYLESNLRAQSVSYIKYPLHDHQIYTPQLVTKIVSFCLKNSSNVIVTTTKDLVKLSPFLNKVYFDNFSIFVVEIEVEIETSQEASRFLSLIKI